MTEAASSTPAPAFRATLSADVAATFLQAAGLDDGTQCITLRESGGADFSSVSLPALGGAENVTLRDGIFTDDAAFWSWAGSIDMNTVPRGTVFIEQLDPSGSTAMTWTLSNAWPTRITGANLRSGGSEVAVESVEIVYETIVVSPP